MASGKHNFIFEQGVDVERVVTWDGPDGSPIDITDYTAAMQVRRQTNSDDTLLSLVSPTNLTIGDALGTITINVTSTVMSALPVGRWVYDLELTSPGEGDEAITTRLLEGVFTVTPEVTR